VAAALLGRGSGKWRARLQTGGFRRAGRPAFRTSRLSPPWWRAKTRRWTRSKRHGYLRRVTGEQSIETSGIAIDSRKRESDNANFHFHDNEARSRNHIGRILLAPIPELDKGKGNRAVRSEDGKTTMVPALIASTRTRRFNAHLKDLRIVVGALRSPRRLPTARYCLSGGPQCCGRRDAAKIVISWQQSACLWRSPDRQCVYPGPRRVRVPRQRPFRAVL
jgi:hypothetical protein